MLNLPEHFLKIREDAFNTWFFNSNKTIKIDYPVSIFFVCFSYQELIALFCAQMAKTCVEKRKCAGKIDQKIPNV